MVSTLLGTASSWSRNIGLHFTFILADVGNAIRSLNPVLFTKCGFGPALSTSLVGHETGIAWLLFTDFEADVGRAWERGQVIPGVIDASCNYTCVIM